MASAERQAQEPLYQLRSDGLAVIAISGPMTKYPHSFQSLFGGTSTLRTRQAIRSAVRDDQVLGIMVVVDSPGGTVAGTSDLADEIRKADARKPVYTYAEDLAASAGLLALAQGRKVFANANAQVGSIGVYLVIEDTSQRFAQAGVKVHVVSSAPPIKGAGVHGAEVTPPQLAEWERQVRDLADLFASEVATGRRMDKGKAAALATGQMWVAEKAKDNGLIDDVVSLDEAMRRLRSEAMTDKDTKAALALAEEAEKTAATEKAGRIAAEARVKELEAELKAKATDPAETPKAADPLAGLSPEAKATVEALQKQAADAQAEVAKLRTDARKKEFADKAAAFKHLPAGKVALGELLRESAEALKVESYAALEELLRASDALAKSAFDEKGASGATGGANSAMEQIEALARPKVASGEVKTLPQAIAAVTREKPELARQHRDEVRKGAN